MLAADSASTTPKAKKSYCEGESLKVLAVVMEHAFTQFVLFNVNGTEKDRRRAVNSVTTVFIFHSATSFVLETLVVSAPCRIAFAEKGKGTVDMLGHVAMKFDDARLRVANCLFVPDQGYNLVSSGRLTDKAISSSFDSHEMRYSLNSKTDVGVATLGSS